MLRRAEPPTRTPECQLAVKDTCRVDDRLAGMLARKHQAGSELFVVCALFSEALFVRCCRAPLGGGSLRGCACVWLRVRPAFSNSRFFSRLLNVLLICPRPWK